MWRRLDRLSPQPPCHTASHAQFPVILSTVLLDIEPVACYRVRGSRTCEGQDPCPRSHSWNMAQPDLETEWPHSRLLHVWWECGGALAGWFSFMAHFRFFFPFFKMLPCEPCLKFLLNLMQYCFHHMFWCFGCEACGILPPQPGVKQALLALEGKILTLDCQGSPSF